MKPLNNELIDKVMAKIAADPDSWDQSDWICETTACFAGHALLETGQYEIKVEVFGECPYRTSGCQCNIGVALANKDTGMVANIHREAQEALGFTGWEANRVFLDTCTNLAEMTSVIDDIRAQRAETEEDCDIIDAELTRRHDKAFDDLHG